MRLLALSIILLMAMLASASGCRATPEERLARLRVEKARNDDAERDILRELDRRQAVYDDRLDDQEAAVREKYVKAKRTYVGPSAERYHAVLSDPGAQDPERVSEANTRIVTAKVAFTEADRKYSAVLDPKERAYLDAIAKKRRLIAEKINAKKVYVMAEHASRRRAIDGEIAAIEARRR